MTWEEFLLSLIASLTASATVTYFARTTYPPEETPLLYPE